MDGTGPSCYSGSVNRTHFWLRASLFVAVLSVVLAWAFPSLAAFVPPPLVGHVVDVPGALSGGERANLDAKLDHARKTRGAAVVVLITGPLDGVPIEDVAYETFNKWGVGQSGKDDGVLLVVAPQDRKLRIETGKGVGGAITDVQSSHINRDIIGPALAQGDTYGAIDRGTDALLAALAKDAVENPQAPKVKKKSPLENPLVLGTIAGVLLLIVVLAIVSRPFRVFLFAFLRIFWIILEVFGIFGGRGGGGGSSYRGGGGQSGGGGSSDDY